MGNPSAKEPRTPRDRATCAHYWKVVGIPGSRWIAEHAMARCYHCDSWCVVEYGAGVGPCEHSIGALSGERLLYGEPPLEKEMTPEEYAEWEARVGKETAERLNSDAGGE